jgi:hypothetical protein
MIQSSDDAVVAQVVSLLEPLRDLIAEASRPPSSQYAFAKRAGIDPATVGRILRREIAIPTLMTVVEIAQALGKHLVLVDHVNPAGTSATNNPVTRVRS